MRKFIKLSSLLIAFFYSFGLMAQTDSSLVVSNTDSSNFSFELKADLVSRYVWRGMNLSESPSIQPTMSIAYKNLTFGTWGSYSFAKEQLQEVDLFLSYESDYLKFTLNDYYNPFDSIGMNGDYFVLENSKTRHIIEGVFGIHDPKDIPIAVEFSMMFYGNDFNSKGERLFSTYVEINYSGKFQNIEYKPFIGLTPSKSYYGEKAGIVNLGIIGTKKIKLKEEQEIPMSVGFILNPQKQNVYLVFGLSL